MAVDLSQNQKLFASALSKSTGLDPATVESWMIAEEPAGAQSGYQGTQDWLNVGITDSGPKGAGNSVWSNPVSAADATANWMKGTWADPGFGTASPGIQSILKTVHESPAQQLAAIAGSGWASSGYGGAAKLQSLLGQVAGTSLPNTPAGQTGDTTLNKIPMVNANFGTVPTGGSGPNIYSTLAGLETAREAIASENPNVKQNFSNVEGNWQALSNLFSSQQSNSTQPSTVKTVAPQPQPGAPSSGTDVSPFKPGTQLGRSDMGVDLGMPALKPGDPIAAMNTSQVVGITRNWYSGQPYVAMKLLAGPNAGKIWYVAEEITKLPKVGQVIPRGQAVAVFAPSGTGIEIGWADPNDWTKTLAQGTTGYTEGEQTNAGKGFRNYLQGLGA